MTKKVISVFFHALLSIMHEIINHMVTIISEGPEKVRPYIECQFLTLAYPLSLVAYITAQVPAQGRMYIRSS